MRRSVAAWRWWGRRSLGSPGAPYPAPDPGAGYCSAKIPAFQWQSRNYLCFFKVKKRVLFHVVGSVSDPDPGFFADPDPGL